MIDYLNSIGHENILDLLLYCLVSIDYYSDKIRKFSYDILNYLFSSLQILHYQDLLNKLSKLIITEKSFKILNPTSIPPHIHILNIFNKVINLQNKL